jgi:hypothetical protein
MRRSRTWTWPTWAALAAGVLDVGCSSIGPRALEQTRLPYNEAVKITTEEQLLLNIVRLRYTDTPSSLAISNIAAQFELTKGLQIVPFFTATGGDNNRGSYAATLPQAQIGGADRPTFSLTPLDDQEFTKKLFTPLSLDGVIYLAKTTWPISTVFRLYLENLNWVSNAETASGPTPKLAPVFAEFQHGMEVLQALQDHGHIAFGLEERTETAAGPLPASVIKAADVIEAAKNGYEYRPDDGGATWTLVKKVQQPVLRVDPEAMDSPEMRALANVFKIKPGLSQYDVTLEALSPFPSTYPAEGVTKVDLETRSLLQAMYYLSHGVEIPPEHTDRGLVTVTRDEGGRPFEWQQVLKGLFHVHWTKARERPADAHVAVEYKGFWFFIDDRDQDTKTTFSLLMELARLELTGKGSQPLLTIPLGGR